MRIHVLDTYDTDFTRNAY